MKISLYTLVLVLMCCVYDTSAQEKEIQKTKVDSFIVLGNCYTCKVRIEDAANTVPGLTVCNWRIDAEILWVDYNDAICSKQDIARAVANVGHDTEFFQATDSAYNTLVGTCCEYDRWYWAGIKDISMSDEINVYPVPVVDIINIAFKETSQQGNYEVIIYNIQGQMVENKSIPSGLVQLDLGFLNSGTHLMIITRDKKTVYHSTFTKI